MLNSFFERASSWRRLAAHTDRPTLETLCRYLRRRGYRADVIRGYVRSAEHFANWLRRERKRTLFRAREEDYEDFLSKHLTRCRCATPRQKHRITVRAALEQLRRSLGQSPVFRKALARHVRRPVVRQYIEHLRNVGGLAEATCSPRARYIEEFLDYASQQGSRSLASIRREHVVAFVSAYGKRCSAGTAAAVTVALRSFLRFLRMSGRSRKDIAAAVPHLAQWRLAGLPQVMNETQIAQFVAVLRNNAKSGRRDLAAGLCMLELGLRVGEVAALNLDDIDWRRPTVTIRGGKCQRARELPLLPKLRSALVDYVTKERPKSRSRRAFLRYSPPHGTPAGVMLIRGIVRRAYAAVDGAEDWTGTHILRRTTASRLHNSGVSLKGVADVLGHASVDTAAIYTKLDLATLRQVALPWPWRNVQ